MQSFGWPTGVLFPLRVADEFRNHLLAHAELGLDHRRAVEPFSRYLQAEEVGSAPGSTWADSETAMELSRLR